MYKAVLFPLVYFITQLHSQLLQLLLLPEEYNTLITTKNNQDEVPRSLHHPFRRRCPPSDRIEADGTPDYSESTLDRGLCASQTADLQGSMRRQVKLCILLDPVSLRAGARQSKVGRSQLPQIRNAHANNNPDTLLAYANKLGSGPVQATDVQAVLQELVKLRILLGPVSLQPSTTGRSTG